MSNTTAFEKFNLSGKSALVTGGSAGLGFAMSRALASAGARVMIAARREDVLENAAAKLTEYSTAGPVLYRKLDLSDPDGVAVAADHACREMNGVDIFVANAAHEHMQFVDDITDEAVAMNYQVNVASNIALVKKFLPEMRNRHWGRIILISTVAAVRASAQEGTSMYSANKAALNAFGRVVAAEQGHNGITVNNVNCGAYMTEMLKGVIDNLEPSAKDHFVRSMTDSTALGRMGECEEIEGTIQLLASDAGSYITGADIHVDGGLAIMMKPNPAQA